ncbi:MAG: lytic transglycosylase domain-containing protein [Pseudomonadota bacterium]
MLCAAKTLLLSIAVSALFTTAASAATYLYRQADGTLLHTDLPPHRTDHQKLTLLRVIRRASAAKASYARAHSQRNQYAKCTGVRSEAMRKRARSLEPKIKSLAAEYKVSKHLVMAVVAAESCFDKDAVSRAGAAGLMQLMPATARSLGVVDPFDTDQNLRAGIQYLSQLATEFDYNHKLVLAAYNAGPGNVRKYKGIPPFAETRTYVTRVMANYLHYLQTPLD